MEYLVITLKAIAAYFVLMLIGVNLIGFVVRGFMLADTVTNNETAKEIYDKSSITLPIVSMLFLICKKEVSKRHSWSLSFLIFINYISSPCGFQFVELDFWFIKFCREKS